ncbi:MAG: hypothetical protein GXP42_14325 [Chloroflexi bacterium]|nr:hypothetical protein [Chloroflexota bacterium]
MSKKIPCLLLIFALFALFLSSRIGQQAMATTTQDKIYVAIDAGQALADATLYALNPDGGGKTPIFDFHNQPKDARGGVWGLRAQGDALYFHSDHADLYTPASRNLFRVPLDGSWLDQITPGPHAGDWNQPCPCGVVTGYVRQSNGQPWGGAPVFLGGVGSVNSNPDGSFRFDNVPQGPRWIVAYRPGDSSIYDAQSISVTPGATLDVQLVPDSSARMNFEYPVRFGDRIYYRFSSTAIQWTTLDFDAPVEVYKTAGFCTGVPMVDGFDAAPSSGRLAILNYQEGCGVTDTEHRGLYLADKDGGNLRLLVDMMADASWSETGVPQGVFWSPDERFIALNALYAGNPVIAVFDANSGAFLSGVTYPATWEDTYGLDFFGWSPDGRWLLYLVHRYRIAEPEQRILAKIPVATDGALDVQSIVGLLDDPNIEAATWAAASHESPSSRVFLPKLINH